MMSYRTPIHQEHRNGGHDSNSQTGGVGDFVGYPPATRFRRGLDFQSGGMDEFLGIGSPFTTQDYLYNEDSFSSDDLLSTPTDAAQDNIQDFAVNDLSWNTNLSFSTTFDHEGEHTDSFSICQAQNQYLNEYYSGSVAGAHFWAADGDTSLNPPWKNCNQNIPRTALRDELVNQIMKNATPHILEALEDEMMRLSACGRDAPKKGHGTKDKARAHCKLKDSKL